MAGRGARARRCERRVEYMESAGADELRSTLVRIRGRIASVRSAVKALPTLEAKVADLEQRLVTTTNGKGTA